MANKHFFKPLLPGFHSHLTIPEAFLKYIERRNEQKMAKLRSDASKITWEVKVEEEKLTDGWKEFALAHDLRIGDIVVFRQERDMAFHVTLLGASCCEIQYGSCLDNENENNLEKIQRKKKVKKNPKRETESSALDPSCFVANVLPSTLRYDTLYFPTTFARANSLDTRCGEIVLMNEKGKSWTLALTQKKNGTFYITRGWRCFCGANGLKAGDSFTFKLIQRGKTLVLRMSTTESVEDEEESSEGDEMESLSTESESDEESNFEKIQRTRKVKNNPRREASSSLDPSCFVANVSPATLRYDKLNLPRSFARENGLDTRIGEIVLMNEKGKSWTLDLKGKKSYGTVYIKRGWRSFCHANGIKAGGFFTFKLIQRGGTPVLRLLSEEPEEEECSESDEIESLSTEGESDEESNQEEESLKKRSSSPSQNRFVTLTLTPNNLKKSILFLPVAFTRMHGIKEETKITLLGKYGVNWSTNLRGENKGERIRLVGGWKEFFKANSVKTGESVKLELIWKANRSSCVLKFCSIVKPKKK